MPDREISGLIVAAARSMEAETGTQHTMDRALELAQELVEGCEEAGISVMRHGSMESRAATSAMVVELDRLQSQHGEGPCMDALLHDEMVYSPSIGTDPRWPTWGPAAVQLTTVRSMMCFRLFTSENVVGALNLFATNERAFDAVDRDHGVVLAAHAAIAVVAAAHAEQMDVALDSRTITAQATGMLMERFDLRPDKAFEVLKRVSSQTNRKLHDVAQELVTTHVLPQSSQQSPETPPLRC